MACALLPVLLRWPVPGALALAALAAVSPAATPAATVGTLHVAEWRRFAVAAGVGAAGVVAGAVQGLWRPVGGLPYIWWLVLVAAVEAALVGWGALTQARRALIASLQERARRAEAEQGRRVAEARVAERTRIAREMHDVLAHRLSLLATYAGAMEYRPDAPPEQVARAAGVVRAGAHQALDELREVISVLREDDGDGDGAGGRSRGWPTCRGWSRSPATPGSACGWTTELPTPAALPAAAGRTAYRVVQEGLTNARKHAPGAAGRRSCIDGRPGGGLLIEIRQPAGQRAGRRPAVPRQRDRPDRADRAGRAGRRASSTTAATPTASSGCAPRLPWPA